MDHILYAWIKIIGSIYIFISVILLLWGLKLVKFYVSLISGSIFGMLGLIIGISGELDAIVLILFFLFMIHLGFVLGWYLYQGFIIVISGFLFSIVLSLLTIISGLPKELIPITAIVFFLLGGYIADKMHKYLILISLSLSSSIFVYTTILFLTLKTLDWEIILNYLTIGFIPFIITTATFILFSIYFQQLLLTQNQNEEERITEINTARGVCISFGIIAAFNYLFDVSTERSITEMWDYSRIIGINIVNWPILAILTSQLMKYLHRKFIENVVYKYYVLVLLLIFIIPTFSILLNLSLLPSYNYDSLYRRLFGFFRTPSGSLFDFISYEFQAINMFNKIAIRVPISISFIVFIVFQKKIGDLLVKITSKSAKNNI